MQLSHSVFRPKIPTQNSRKGLTIRRQNLTRCRYTIRLTTASGLRLRIGSARTCLRLCRLICFVTACLEQRLAVQPVLLPIWFERHFAVPPGPVHRIDIGIKHYLIEVPYYDGERRQDSLIQMNGGGYIQPPPSQPSANEHVRPKHDAGGCHHDESPDQRPVLCFLGVAETRELGLLLAQSEIVQEYSPDVRGIFQLGQEIRDQLPPGARHCDVDDVINADPDEDNTGHAMDDA